MRMTKSHKQVAIKTLSFHLLQMVVGCCLFAICILQWPSDAHGIYGLQKPDWPEDIRELTWNTWQKRRKGILWQWNVFHTAILLKLADENAYLLSNVEYLKPVANGKKDFADHSMVHLQFLEEDDEERNKTIDVIMESFNGQFFGHQFYSEDADENMYANYIQSGRHQSYIATKCKTCFDGPISYKLAFERIQGLHRKLSLGLSESSCHIYAWKLYGLFDTKRFITNRWN